MDNTYSGMYERYYKGCVGNIASYFNEYKELIKKSNFHKYYEREGKKCLSNLVGNNIKGEVYDNLTEYCSIKSLTVNGELQKIAKNSFEWCKDPIDPSIVDNVELRTVSHTKQRNLLPNNKMALKYKTEKIITYKEVSVGSQVLTPESDVLIFVRVYVPFSSRHKHVPGALGTLSIHCTIAMYGSQTLDKLKDQISCPSDQSILKEISAAPIRQKVQNAKDVYKSGFFFIEDTFYNDFRDPQNQDNSKVIRKWAKTHNFGTYKTAKMEETRLDSLVLKFGFPYVYQHQGDCEHLIAFSDARLANVTDELNVDCYPRIVRIKPRPNRYCMTCGIYNAKWIVTSNERLPHNPCFFCDSCFKSYNYIKGKKIGSFQAYPYPYDSELLGLNPNSLEKK